MTTPSPLLAGLIALALEAGRAVMAIYGGDPRSRTKPDDTPLTDADLASERIILAGLRSLDPGTPVISEESVGGQELNARRFFLVDPLDGTREFLDRNGEFTINIALIEEAEPVAGVIFAPALARLFWADRAAGAFEARISPDGSLVAAIDRRLETAPSGTAAPRGLASRSHGDSETLAWLKKQGVASLSNIGSSLKFCLLAAGEADVYPRFGRTMEWDTAAGHAILAAAGGSIETRDGAPLRYGKAQLGFANPHFIARGA